MIAYGDARKAFIVDTVLGAIAPASEQKVNSAIRSTTPCWLSKACCNSSTLLLQAAYAEYIAKDDSGAIAAFLDDDSTSILQVIS